MLGIFNVQNVNLNSLFYFPAGLEVRALMRDPSRMPEELRKQVEVITGDVLVEEDVDKVVEGRDAIVVTLGTRNDLGMVIIIDLKLYT